MQSNEQVAAAEEARIEEDKKQFRALCRQFLEFEQSDAALSEKQKQCRAIYDRAIDHFNICEQSVANSDLLGAHKNERWVRTKAETSLNTLDAIVQFQESFHGLCGKLQVEIPPFSPTAFAAMQRLVSEHFPEEASTLRGRFTANKLPTFGFDRPLPTSRPADGNTNLEFSEHGISRITNVKSEDAKQILANYGKVTTPTMSVSGAIKSTEIVETAKATKDTAVAPAKPTYRRSIFTEMAITPVKIVSTISAGILLTVLLYFLKTQTGCQVFQQPAKNAATGAINERK